MEIKKLTIISIDGNDLNPIISTSTILQLSNSKTYYRNYVHGTWALSKNNFSIHPNDAEIDDWKYKIIYLIYTELTVQINKTEEKYFCDFDQFESNKILQITIIHSREK
jgi:hypothetical protein